MHHFVLRVPARFNPQKHKDGGALLASLLFGTPETKNTDKQCKGVQYSDMQPKRMRTWACRLRFIECSLREGNKP